MLTFVKKNTVNLDMALVPLDTVATRNSMEHPGEQDITHEV